MLLREIKHIFHKELDFLYEEEEVNSFFNLMVGHYLGLERFILVVQPEYVLTKKEEQPLFEGLSRLKREEPIQYILGEAHFMDLTLKVNGHVLIPRPETEELVQWVISEIGNPKSEARILDVGTGSGCIAIALAKALPNAQVFAMDISEEALKVAAENAKLNKAHVEFVRADMLNLKFGFEFVPIAIGIEFDVIVSNPPYVRELEKVEIKNNVKEYEPSSALFVPDESPLLFYEAIVGFAAEALKNSGQLFFEINQYLAKETEQLLVDNRFKEVELHKDIFGNFRMLKGTKQ